MKTFNVYFRNNWPCEINAPDIIFDHQHSFISPLLKLFSYLSCCTNSTPAVCNVVKLSQPFFENTLNPKNLMNIIEDVYNCNRLYFDRRS